MLCVLNPLAFGGIQVSKRHLILAAAPKPSPLPRAGSSMSCMRWREGQRISLRH